VNTSSEIYDKVAGGTVGNWLAIIGVLSLIYWAYRLAAAWQHRHDADPQAMVEPTAAAALSAAQPAPRPGAPDDDIVVIAAAVHAMGGAHRVVHLKADPAAQIWAAEGRWMQQTSHKPR
jgi:hypothetical protein